jgi:hypothetical protein
MKQQPQYFAGPQQGQQSQQQQQGQQASEARPQQAMPSAAPDANMMPAPSQPAPTPIPAPNQTMPAPAPTSAPTTGAASTPAPTPTTDPANYDYLAEMQKMGQMYDVGGQYDLNQQALTAEKARQQNMIAWAQNQLAGRGGTATQAQQNYMNTMAALEADTARAQLSQGAHQTELSNRLTFNKQVSDTKMDLVKMANELGYNLTDAQYNQIAYEIANAYQGGRPVTPGSMVAMLNEGAGNGAPNKVKESVNQKAHQVSNILNKNDWNSEQNLVGVFQSMDAAEAKAFYADPENRSLLQKALDTTWGSDNDKIREVFYKIGVYNL